MNWIKGQHILKTHTWCGWFIGQSDGNLHFEVIVDSGMHYQFWFPPNQVKHLVKCGEWKQYNA